MPSVLIANSLYLRCKPAHEPEGEFVLQGGEDGNARVISIERAARAKGSAALHFLGQDMTKSTVDELVQMQLAIGPGGALEEVLALIVLRTEHSAEVVLADAHGQVVSRAIPCQNGSLPEHYRSTPLGPIDAVLAQDQNALDRLLQQDANLVHGRLTLARAVLAMVTDKLDARQALEQAIGTGEKCRAFEQGVQTGAADFTSWASAAR